MVNQGKPSSDCFPCRKRKLRCDLRINGCSQCHRARLSCYGYRNPNDLIIRDETDSTKQKVLARQATAYPATPKTLQLGWDVRARDSFFVEYVLQFSRSYDVLTTLYSRASATDHLSASVDAVSLALLSFQSNAPALRHLARERYGVALHKVGHALRVPNISATNEILQSVLLLDLYEKLVNQSPHSSMAWTSHVLGAISLVMSGANNIISNHTGRRLATRLAVTLAISCGAATLRVPESLFSLRKDLSSFLNDAKWDFTGLVVQVVNLSADIADRRITMPTEIVERSKEIDVQFRILEKNLPPSWMPTRKLGPRHPLVFHCYYDIYLDHYVTQVCNAVRTLRLMLNIIIVTYSDSQSDLRSDAIEIIGELAGQICAAVPQFVLLGGRPENQVPFSPLQRLQCYTLIAPIYFAGQVGKDHGLRAWAINTLDYIAETGVMKTAKDVASILRDAPETDYWKIYSMLGCYALAA